jgi:RNA polymerase sigma factor (sigma-70 family)
MAVASNTIQPPATCTEHDLVAAVRCGDDGAFGELYSRYSRRIAAYVLGMVGDHGRAEDITQEVFISALRRMRDSEQPIAFKPWIYEIAKNACIDEFRRARRTREIPLDTDDADEGGIVHRGLLSSGPTPDVAAESRQQLTDLRGAFGGLSESHHKILVLREFEGLSYTEIGERMGLTRPVVESTLFRARRKLSEEYEELVTGRRCERVQTVIGSAAMRRGRALGIREQRLLARHLAHCQACRRHAHLAGFDDAALRPTGVIGKIAALLPLPVGFWRWRRGGGGGGGGGRSAAVAARGSHSIDALQTVTTYASPSSPLSGFGRAAAAVAALAIAGAGGGVVAGVTSQSSPSHRQSSSGAAGATAASAAAPTSLHGGSGTAAPAGSSGGVGGAARAGTGKRHKVASSATPGNGRASAAGSWGGGPAAGSAPRSPAGTSSIGGSSGSSGAAGSAPSGTSGSSGGSSGLTVSTPSALHNVAGTGSLPSVGLPQLPSLNNAPKPGGVVGKVVGALTGALGSGGGSSSSSSPTSGTSSTPSTTSSGSSSGSGVPLNLGNATSSTLGKLTGG